MNQPRSVRAWRWRSRPASVLLHVLSWIAFVQVGFGQDALTTWVISGDLKFAQALRVDT